MKPFSESSYLSQVRSLRELANEVLTQYQIGKYKLDFINHGENATFKVSTSDKSYLLRIHRGGYHSKSALLEELNWLKRLSGKPSLYIQKPQLNKSGKILSEQNTDKIPLRYCSLMSWQEGRGRYKNLTPQNLYQLGFLLAELHNSTQNTRVKHRHYWDADGLIGKNAKLGSILPLQNELSAREFADVNKCRLKTLAKIRKYQNNFPERMSLIHADMHFGNVLWEGDNLKPIDFDDCGYGLQMYDLAVVFYSLTGRLKPGTKKLSVFRDSLYSGYRELRNLDVVDEKIMPHLLLARELAMFAWTYDRRDNQRLYENFKNRKKGYVKFFRKALKKGPPQI